MLKQDVPFIKTGHPLLWYIQAQASRNLGTLFFVEDKVVGKIASGRCDFCENGEYKLSDWTDNG
ncbi:hypothetical protein [Paenibacillus polymyxa]|jgi:hypothetical protein|uniref:hypothetical protein n=1 Tax=Paenibacillus polymyxa TaxID=1406 RepID=UPI000378B3EC|nr:hypothetical protein [Paenibacillus polymyxa]MBE7901007.1 hypothetical protein [Paenibacillus polymyxa]MBG9765384.1 hypothetical protein [Paenibacillus polymyxa]QPK52365.1 hypothetical protein G7035_06410 [Paenibacillus polymyxa]